MTIREEQGDVFELANTHYLVHCISADFALGKGIAKEIDKRYDMREQLLARKDPHLAGLAPSQQEYLMAGNPNCISIGGVINLITKKNYYDKPTYGTLRAALYNMRHYLDYMKKTGVPITQLAMPRIGCGLDKLEWPKVKAIIEEVFAPYDDLEIEVRYL